VRLAAYLIDGIIVGIVTAIADLVIFCMVFGSSPDLLNQLASQNFSVYEFSDTIISSLLLFYGLVLLANTVIGASYYTIAIGKWGKTLGKAALSLKVVKADGTRVGYWRAFARYWAYVLNGFTLGIGFLVIAWTQRKQGLHDIICDTVVIRTD
jgi:uncharacterized RDD family membrane protein YckC